ncbi:hypothetical protein BDA96_04G087400 [Sorghum bicolor]|uniref:Uncharacterized protein n=1 Tax=Sorghum bicolor TaxID=4558 RepID=A0A921R3Z3_SORBI|nr:hypothetical protein BDA96_04G087400 [Sorghum bicolor]
MSVTHHMANPQFLPEIFSAAAENLPYTSQDRKAHCKFASCPENVYKKKSPAAGARPSASRSTCGQPTRPRGPAVLAIGGEGRGRGGSGGGRSRALRSDRSCSHSALQPERPNPSRSRTGGGQGVGADPAVALSRWWCCVDLRSAIRSSPSNWAAICALVPIQSKFYASRSHIG